MAKDEGGGQSLANTGIVRVVDRLGRIVLPKELRDTLGFQKRDSVEYFVDGPLIVVRKFEPNCVFCGRGDHTVWFKGKRLCVQCIGNLSGGL